MRWCSLALWLIPASAAFADEPAAGKKTVQYARDVQPILANYCFTCHGPDESTLKAGLRLDTSAGATKKLRRGSIAIVPGHPGKSELIARIFAEDESERMPPIKAQKVM